MKTAVFHYALSALLLLVYLPLPLTATTQADEPDLAAWLAEHPLVSEAIRWKDSNGPTRAYPNWSETQKADLYETYQAVWSGHSLELTDPPPNMVHLADDQSDLTVLSKDHAWSLFLAHVAYSLAVETGGWVPWSLTEYSQDELLELFDGSRTFRRTSGGYELIHRAVPAPPDATFEFLSANLMIAQDRLHTIGNLLEWSRDLIHFLGDFTAKNVEDHWQYRGVPPVSRVISGTRAVFYPYKKGDTSPPVVTFGHHTAGCWGTTAFLRAVLRVVNIPVKEVTGSGSTGRHSMPYFMSEGKYLSHSDDLYSQNTRSSPGFPIEELFIDQATYDAWFGPGVSLPQGKSNVSRRTSDLAIKYLPRILLSQRCRDIREGRSRSKSLVWSWAGFPNYSVEELEAMNLWDRIDAKIDGLGGCPIENSWIVFEPRTPTIVKISGPITASESRLVVAVRDSEGQPIEGHLVTFTGTSGDGTLSMTRITTDADGRAESRLTLGPDAGTNSVSALAAGVEQPVIFTAAGQEITAVGQAIPQSLTKVSGDGQQGPAGTVLAAPFVVSVLDEDGEAIAGVVVTFSVTTGGGMLSSTTATTDANGRARSTLTLGSEPGTNTVTATVEGLESETFTAIGQATTDSDGNSEIADDEPSGEDQQESEEQPTSTVELEGISSSHDSVREDDGQATTITLTVTLDKAAAADEQITLAIVTPTEGKTAKRGEDFDATLDGTITIAKGQRTGTAQLILTPKDNTTVDGHKALGVQATSLSGHKALINIKIDDDELDDGEVADGEEEDGEEKDGKEDDNEEDDGEMAFGFTGEVEDQAYTAGTTISDLVLPEAVGGEGEITYRVSELPLGLSFDDSTRTISGTPDVATDGAVEVTYTAQDSAEAAATLTFSITVNPALSFGDFFDLFN